MIRLLTTIFGGGLVDQLRRAYEAKLTASNDAERIAADRELARLENKLATSDNPYLQFAIGLIALSLGGHLAMVAFVSAFPMWGWTVHKLPAPMDQWQAEIIMALFGLQAVTKIFKR